MKSFLSSSFVLFSSFLIIGCESEVEVQDDPVKSQEFQQDYQKQMEEEMKNQGRMPGN